MIIDKLIRFYVDLYEEGYSNSAIASKILAAHPEADIAHRTLRRKIGRYRGMEDSGDPIAEAVANLPFVETKAPLLMPYLVGDPRNVLVIGDPHAPFGRKGYKEHCRAVQQEYNCGTVVCIGDIVDSHYSSFHDQDPDGMSAGDELEATLVETREWQRLFPKAYCTIGNHDAIIMRKAFKNGVSKRWIRGLSEVLEMPGWEFLEQIEIDGVLYVHHLGGNLLNVAMARSQSVVCGHLHTKAEIQWNVNDKRRIFAMQTGCGIDDKAYAFAYAKTTAKKSVISCAIVKEGKIPIIVPMEL